MTVNTGTPTHKIGDYSKKELKALQNIPRGTKGVGKVIADLADKLGRGHHNLYLKWNSLHPKLDGTNPSRPHKRKDDKPVSVASPMPTGTKRAYNKAIHTVVAPAKGKDVIELVLEEGAEPPRRGMRHSTIELFAKLKPLVQKMLPLGNGVVHSIPIATSSKTSIRKMLSTDPDLTNNKYVVTPIKDNPKMSRIFRYK